MFWSGGGQWGVDNVPRGFNVFRKEKEKKLGDAVL